MSLDDVLLTRHGLEALGYEYMGCYGYSLIMQSNEQTLLVERTGELLGSYKENKPLRLRGLYVGVQLDLFYNKNGVDSL